jgi:uncharacterized protein
MTRGLRLAWVLLAVPALAAAQTPPPEPPGIVTHGSGEIKRAPDQAWVVIAAETRGTTPAEAQRASAEAMTSVQSALQKASLPADAIKTTGYSLTPDTEWVNGRSRVRGYIARNQIEVRVDVLDRLGAVIDAAGSSGATQIAGLRFDIKDRANLEREALRLAVEDALARARAMAAGAKMTLGPILRIEDEMQPVYKPMPMMMERAATAAAPQTPITPGEIDISARVTLVVAIKG